MDTKHVIVTINQSMGIELPLALSYDEIKVRLSTYLNSLAGTDFNKLVNLLYRLDIDEMKFRKALAENGDRDAGSIIAEMVLQRLVEKVEARKKFRRMDDSIDDEEKW